jgi:hypothetical protein
MTQVPAALCTVALLPHVHLLVDLVALLKLRRQGVRNEGVRPSALVYVTGCALRACFVQVFREALRSAGAAGSRMRCRMYSNSDSSV